MLRRRYKLAAVLDGVVADPVARRYAPFYAGSAVVSVVLVFFPPFDDVAVGGPDDPRTVTFGSLFDMAGRLAGGPAVFGLLLLAAQIGLLVAATFRVRSAALPGWIASLAALIALMLVTRPATGTPPPHLTGAGLAGLAVVTATGVLAAAHALHLTVIRRRS